MPYVADENETKSKIDWWLLVIIGLGVLAMFYELFVGGV